MRTFWKVSLIVLGSVLALAAALYGYLLYAPSPAEPVLSATVQAKTLRVGGRDRTYLAYVPAKLPKNAAIVLVLHGSSLQGKAMRPLTNYEFEKAADQQGFVVLYPDGYEKNWNDCRREATFPAKTENIDDIGFLRALVAQCRAAYGSDPAQVYAFGYSNGGHMAFRLATEAPDLVAAVTAVAASLPTPASCSCPLAGRTARVMLVNGTKDPVNPYQGGPVTIFGLSPRGSVLSAPATAENFAQRNGLTDPPAVTPLPHLHPDDATSVQKLVWAQHGQPYVALYAVQGGGHVIPLPGLRASRLLGPTTGDFSAPQQALAFFGLAAGHYVPGQK